MSLTTKAALVYLKISRWSASKYDRKATQAVNTEFSAENAGRFNKRLVDPDMLKAIGKVATEMYNYHLSMTLPWTDGGTRLIPAVKLVEYKTKMYEFQNRFENEVSRFCINYDQYVEEAKTRLGDLYRSEEYPPCDALRHKFGVRLSFSPIPTLSDDFRIEASIDQGAFRHELDMTIKQRHIDAVRDLATRAKKAVTPLVAAIKRSSGGDKSRFSQSLIENIRNLVEIIPAMNYTNDPTIAQMANDLQDLVKYDKDTLKKDPQAKEFVLRRANELKNKFF